MRFAALSDIHGNALALAAVLQDIEGQSVEFSVNLGDCFSGPFQPRETAELVRSSLPRTVRGNHDRQLAGLPAETMGVSDRHAYDALTEDVLTWTRGLPERIELDPGVVLVHGSPRRDDEYLLTTIGASGPRPATAEEVRERLGDAQSAALVLCGHSHISRELQLPNGPLVVDVGSVGWQAWGGDARFPYVIESGSPHARYAIFDDASGSWVAERRYVVYDWEAAAIVAERNSRPEAGFAARHGRVSGLVISLGD